MKVWITKYALTSGIFDVEAEQCVNIDAVSYMLPDCYRQYAYSGNWHKTFEAAVQRAEEMRAKKIASLKKQIEKLEKLRFTS